MRKVPGEGEHKLINYIRNHGDKDESYCVHALDADLVMLGLGTHIEHFYILRDDLFHDEFDYSYICLSQLRKRLVDDTLLWENKDEPYDSESAINDFILLCFMTGNDFLPHIPSIEIIEEGIEHILSIYTKYKTHLTFKDEKGRVKFDTMKFQNIFLEIGSYENYEYKLNHYKHTFPDRLLLKYSTQDGENGHKLDISAYRDAYYNKHFDGTSGNGLS